MVMKATSLKLVNVEIDQLNEEVLVKWVAPKVLEKERINVMVQKIQEWEDGVGNVLNFVNRK
jgi:hypothetical protein